MSTESPSAAHAELVSPDMQVALMKTEKGAVVRMAVSFSQPHPHQDLHWLQVIGTGGCVELRRSARDRPKLWLAHGLSYRGATGPVAFTSPTGPERETDATRMGIASVFSLTFEGFYVLPGVRSETPIAQNLLLKENPSQSGSAPRPFGSCVMPNLFPFYLCLTLRITRG